jgi:hypothetical protein
MTPNYRLRRWRRVCLDLTRLSHQNWLKQHGGGHGAEQRESHHPPHAGNAWIIRCPHASKRHRVGDGAEDHRPGQGGLQQPSLPVTPGHYVVNFERNADAEQKRQRDDVPAILDVDCFPLSRTADFEKPSRDGKYVLRAKRFGKFWAPERSIKITSGRYTYRSIEALVFAFGEIPIWTRTHQAAMRLAEHCDPIPATPVAGFWRPMFTAT